MTQQKPSLTLLPTKSELRIGDKEIRLTPTEFMLLRVLAEALGEILSREQLVDRVIGTRVMPRTIDVHVKGLRQKLGDWKHVVQTVRGKGYRLTTPLASEDAVHSLIAD